MYFLTDCWLKRPEQEGPQEAKMNKQTQDEVEHGVDKGRKDAVLTTAQAQERKATWFFISLKL